MAESQLLCIDDEHVNEKVSESKPEFYYSEEQRAAIEQLLKNGDGAFKMRLKDDNIKDFLSAREIKWIRKTFHEYDTDNDTEKWETETESKADSGVPSTYWPQLSDIEVPPLDIGWPEGGFYKGVTRVTVHTHPPKENGPHIKEVVRRLIQESSKVVAVVTDLLTDLHILQDLLDAVSKRNVSVYIVLDGHGIPHFLDMCSRLQISALHLRNIRVRTVGGTGLVLSQGKLPGSLCTKYMLVDADKVLFGSYSFTWSTSRMDRNMVTVMTGQVVDTFDKDFRELYAVSEKVDLYKEFSIIQPPLPAQPLVNRYTANHKPPHVTPASRFQVAMGVSQQANLKVPAHKYHNPKYSLVVGNSSGLTGSLQDLTSRRELLDDESVRQRFLLTSSSEKLDKTPTLPSSPVETEKKSALLRLNGLDIKKERSSFRLFLKGRTANQNVAAAGEAPPIYPSPSPLRAQVAPESEEQEDDFEVLVLEKPALLKGKSRKVPKIGQRSASLQAINTLPEEGLKGRKRHQKKCIQS